MNVSKKTVTEINNLSGEQLAAIGALKRVEGKADEFICPFCQNGEGHDATGIKPNKHDITHTGWKCQRCGEKFNNVHILAHHYRLDSKRDFKEICKRACRDFHITYTEEYSCDYDRRNTRNNSSPKPRYSERGIIINDLATGETALKIFIDQQGGSWRGLPFEFLRKKHCRFIKDWLAPKLLAKHPDAKNWANTSPRMIIPASTDTNTANYLARLTVPIDSFTAEQRKYIKEKEHAGTKTLFNADLLTQSETVIAVEGYPDALTLEFCGYPCVATGGAEMYPLITKALRAMETKPNILILFDPDQTGRKAAPKLQKELSEIGCSSAIRFLTDENSKLDANQILVEQGAEKLKAIIDQLISDAQTEFAAFEKKSVVTTNAVTAPTADKMTVEDIREEIRQQCKWSHDKYGNPTKIKSDVVNYELIFEHDPYLHGLFGRDTFRQETVFLKRAQWHDKNLPIKDTWDDTDDAELRLYLAKHYAEMGTPQRTFDFVIRVARENSFHAIRNFFEELPKWDGEERADNIFIKFLGAEDTQYTREITRHFLFGAIARAFYPGCDFQSVVVLQGSQGIGKSRVLRMLGGKHGVNPKGDSWHVALRDQLDDSHAVDAMRKGWIVEIEEFAAASHADVNAMKGVLSADDVTRRFAYDRHAKTVKAHWVFAATCNDDAPLRDQTGNRRFLPIKCHNKESTIVDGMTPEYIQQVWAEAYYKFKQMFPTVEDFNADKLRLDPALQSQAAKFAEASTQDDGLVTEIKGFLDRKIPPLIIWYLLSKEERRKFHANGGNITIEVADLKARFKNSAGRRFDSLKPVFDKACEVRDGFVRKFTDRESRWCYAFYGSEFREHICAAEIFNECFGQDNRKKMPRINEALSTLDGWHAGERIQKTDPAYLDQRKPYYRD
ncbi:MAG: toprim domain-containing protein [Selenomonadaceae bacterium]|nr:toprim domain-containing protein [Selenomonadaceae bacterium]